MDEKFTNLEIIAPSVEEAIEKGLAELGLAEDEVEVEILDHGSRGLFGLGSRQARVRLTILAMSGQTETAPRFIDVTGEALDQEDLFELEEDEPLDQPETIEVQRGRPRDETLEVCQSIVGDLLEKMHVRALVTARYADPEDERSKSMVWVDVSGKDLSILIGPRAETLTALQYIAGLIVSKELGRTVPMMVDVEGFRARRIQQLRQMARRMADQALKTGRRQVLEPMPASERRIIHIELRNNPGVFTESVGEEPRRKVTINPK